MTSRSPCIYLFFVLFKELLLNLPQDSLTKEIALTQDLMTLFLTHQIPSDLLSYDGEELAPTIEKLQRVKSLVSDMNSMIEASKERELKVDSSK